MKSPIRSHSSNRYFSGTHAEKQFSLSVSIRRRTRHVLFCYLERSAVPITPACLSRYFVSRNGKLRWGLRTMDIFRPLRLRLRRQPDQLWVLLPHVRLHDPENDRKNNITYDSHCHLSQPNLRHTSYLTWPLLHLTCIILNYHYLPAAGWHFDPILSIATTLTWPRKGRSCNKDATDQRSADWSKPILALPYLTELLSIS